MTADLIELCEKIGYIFKNIELLKMALTHPSVTQKKLSHYERMEFFGDSILGFVIADFLYNNYTNQTDAILSKMHAFLVSRKSCAIIGKKIQLDRFLILSHGAEVNNERLEDANIANSMEAVIAAIYIDGGLEVVKSIVMKFWLQLIDGDKFYETCDFKTKLQELSQSKYRKIPVYTLISASGPDHNPNFVIRVSVNGINADGSGKNKKSAEQDAAQNCLKLFRV